MARGRAETCRWEKLCKNILVIKNFKQVVFDYILPIYFVKEINAASCEIEELWGTNLSIAKRFDWHLVSVVAAAPAAFVRWDQTLQEWSEGGRTRRCKLGLRAVKPGGASVVWRRWNRAVQAWANGGRTTRCKRGLTAVEPGGASVG